MTVGRPSARVPAGSASPGMSAFVPARVLKSPGSPGWEGGGGRSRAVAVSRRSLAKGVRQDRPALYVRRVRGMGRGVFAGRRFKRGEVIEVCPVVPLTRREERQCRGTVLDRYFFAWNEPGYVVAMVLGLGCVYNTSPDPNARFRQRWS